MDQIAWSQKKYLFWWFGNVFFATIWKDILFGKLYQTSNLKYDDDLILTCKKNEKTKIRFCFWLTRYCKQKWDEEGGGHIKSKQQLFSNLVPNAMTWQAERWNRQTDEEKETSLQERKLNYFIKNKIVALKGFWKQKMNSYGRPI